MEAFESMLGWTTFAGAGIALATAGCLVAALVQAAAGAGCYGGRPLPGGVSRRAARVEARLRERYRPRMAKAAVLEVGPDLSVVEAGTAPDQPERALAA